MSRMKLDILGIKAEAREEQDYPLLDLLETPDQVVIEADLPGVKLEDISLSYLDGALIIEGRKREDTEKGNVRYLCMERTFNRFKRTLQIPVPVNAASVKARYKNGVLTVTFGKVTEKRGRPIRIPVE